jgi:hypothetical protein
MLTANLGKKGNALIVQLTGDVDDAANLEGVIGGIPKPPMELHVNCAQINRINSVGVKGWIKYFRAAEANGVPVYFYDCSPAIVQQMNLVFNFLCGGKVLSLRANFACESCGATSLYTLKVPDLLQSSFNVPDQKCVKCGKAASFDDLPKMYFKFLMTPSKAK